MGSLSLTRIDIPVRLELANAADADKNVRAPVALLRAQPVRRRTGQVPRAMQHRQNLDFCACWQLEDKVVLEIRN